MKTAIAANRRMQWIAGTFAALATLLTMGGSLGLAEHYAQTGASQTPSGYYVTGQIRRIDCPDKGNVRTAVVSPRRSAENS